MRLSDSEREREFRAAVREWLDANGAPAGPGAPRVWDAAALREWSRASWKAGYAGITWPTEYGGRALDGGYQAIHTEECALAEAPDHVNVIGTNMVGPTIIRYGTDRQRSAFLPRILSGDALFCQGFSEPEAGSDLAAVRTVARSHADGFVLDGEKVWSSYAHLADHCLLLARTEPEGPKHEALSCFLIDMRAPGVEVRPLRQMSGDADFSRIALTGVVVPEDRLLGPRGGGWRVAMTTLAHERGTFGIALTARLSVQFARLVRTAIELGKDRDPVVRKDIADLHVQLEALRHTGYRALAALERTGEPGPESAILKLRWSSVNQRVAALGCHLLGEQAQLGGPGTFWGGYWQRQRLRSRTNSIEGGTSEILRGVVAERVLRLPRSRT
ncbi:acyl-CoA dehydrogenase family protein [Qaidamihabitans albus]|uniref:acyl-CoA dehydrogenase family protein n=1 Tax=Qaidamihabitans albus TaxID=2795733 RepID=UPI0018F25ACF|nr:acyl-CoA dehydrogenase family protein [Qaidamihabitans albus]